MTKKNVKYELKVEESYINAKGKPCTKEKADSFKRIFVNTKGKCIKEITIPLEDLKYYVDIGDFDSGGRTVKELQTYIDACKKQLENAGIKKNGFLQVMIKWAIAKIKDYEEQLESLREVAAKSPTEDTHDIEQESDPDAEGVNMDVIATQEELEEAV